MSALDAPVPSSGSTPPGTPPNSRRSPEEALLASEWWTTLSPRGVPWEDEDSEYRLDWFDDLFGGPELADLEQRAVEAFLSALRDLGENSWEVEMAIRVELAQREPTRWPEPPGWVLDRLACHTEATRAM